MQLFQYQGGNAVFTKLEMQIIIRRVLTVLAWMLPFVAYGLMFIYNFILGILFLWFLPYWIWFVLQRSNLYFPQHGYFRYYYRTHSREERWEFGEQAERFGEYTIIGDVAFLDEYVIIKKAGILIEYKDIKKLSFEKEYSGSIPLNNSYAYVLTFELYNRHQKYRYRHYHDPSPVVGDDSQFSHALKWVQSHRAAGESESVCQNEDTSDT